MFTHPLLLIFLPLALVPIVLHLITLFRVKTVELSTFRFLMESYVQQRRRVRLLEFLLMLLRTAFVLMIVLALSRPIVQKFAWMLGGSSGRQIAIVIDNSAAMGLRTGGTTSLERAKGAARTILNMLGPDDHVTVIRSAGGAEPIATGFAARLEPITAAIDRLEPDPATGDMGAALGQVVAAGRQGAGIVYMLTDGQRGALAGLEDHPALAQLGKDRRVVVMNVGPDEPVKNLGVVGDPPQALRPIVGLPVLLGATVVNSSTSDRADTVLSVFLDDELVTQLNVSLQPGQKQTQPITVTPTHAGLIRGRFELPADAFPDDDTYLFCLNVQPRLGVLIVTGDAAAPGATAPPEAPTDRPQVFIRAALTSPLSAQSGAAAEERSIAEALSISQVALGGMSSGMLSEADVVVLADVALEPAKASLLRQYVEEGGGLFILPGPHCNPDAYNLALLGPSAALEGARLPQLAPPVGDPDNEATFAPIGAVDLLHPVLSAFDDPQVAYFTTARVYRHFPITLGDSGAPAPGDSQSESPARADESARAAAHVLMRLPDRSPLLVEATIDQGRVLLAGFAATPDWSNLPLKPEFVPIVLRSTAYLRRTPPAEAPANVRPHGPAPIRVTDRWSAADVQAIDPAGRQHTIDLHRWGRQLIGALLQTDRKGYYTYAVNPHTEAAPQRVDLGFAVNLDVGDADFTSLDESQIRKLLAPIELVYLHSSPDDPILAEQLTHRSEVWRYLIWIMFAVIGIEFLLATLRAGRPTAKPTRSGLKAAAAAGERGAGQADGIPRLRGAMGGKLFDSRAK